MEQREDEQRKKVMVIIRILAGGYLLYLSYDLLNHFQLEQAFEDKFIGGAGVCFFLIGLGLCGWNIYKYIQMIREERKNNE